MAEAAKAFAIVTNLFAAIIVFGGIGYAIDWWQGTGYAFTLVGLAIGLVVGFVSFIRAALKLGGKPPGR